MTITLSPQLEEMIQKKVESGDYRDAGDVILNALELLERRDTRERLLAAIREGDEAYERGDYIVFTADTFDELMRQSAEDERLNVPISDVIRP